MSTVKNHPSDPLIPIRVFLSGQSNALGRGEEGPDWSSLSSTIRVWNNINPLGGVGTAFVSPEAARSGGTFQHTDPTHYTNNFGVWFCERLARFLSRAVDMTIVARGASRIELWDPGEPSYPMLQDCTTVWKATGQAPAHVFLWHQGEGNVTTPSHADYRTLFLDLVANLKRGGVIDDNTLIILGALSEEKDNRREFNHSALQALADQHDGIAYAPSQGLKTYDCTHFIGEALYTFGAEHYFEAFRQSKHNLSGGGSLE